MSSTSEFAQPAIDLRTDVPHSARVYDYLLGGKTNYPPDQAAGRALAHRHPQLRQARSEDE
ncbi:SAM-dependent methyltransferase [Streptomyces sp. NPDC005393]|uniref:SAM-dependent methyltransferase n=1 Tax=Streptomyces sp. NPDC005393 TaxID=3157041 RepID=UPI0033A85151